MRVSKPSGSRDDVTEVSLDLEETYAGMLRELAALESLSVGDLISESELPPKKRVISTRWVVADKRERVDGKEKRLVRCRVVARDFAAGLSAAQLGFSSPTASAEALKIFLAYAGAVGNNILGLDVSTAFLFAELIGEEIIIMLPDGCRGLNGLITLDSSSVAPTQEDVQHDPVRDGGMPLRRHVQAAQSAHLGLRRRYLDHLQLGSGDARDDRAPAR